MVFFSGRCYSILGYIFFTLVFCTHSSYAQQAHPNDEPFLESNLSDVDTVLSQREQEIQWAEENRDGVIQSILNRLQPEADEAGYTGWRDELLVFLSNLSSEQLIKAYHAEGYNNVVTAIRGGDPVRAQPYVQSSELNSNKLLGDTFEDLVFTPLTPCRIIDTRLSGEGKFGVSETRSYSTNNGTAAQGGAANCGVPGSGGEPPAVVLNITSTQASAAGFLKAWQTGAAQPNASILNYRPGGDIANAAIVPSGLTGNDEINIFARQATHVIVDVIGFFRRPQRTPLQLTRVSSSFNLSGNSNVTMFSPFCPSGTRWVSGDSYQNTSNNVVVLGTIRNGGNERTVCRFRNNELFTTRQVLCLANCANVPGY